MRGAESLQIALLTGFQRFPLVKFYYLAHYFRWIFRVVGQEMGQKNIQNKILRKIAQTEDFIFHSILGIFLNIKSFDSSGNIIPTS